MPKLKDVVSSVSRKVVDDAYEDTLFGKRLKTFVCKVCGETGIHREAYMQSRSKRRFGETIREYHATCWNDFNGKTSKRLKAEAKASDSSPPLIEFFGTTL